jgi:hypothetical protein
MVRAAPNGAYLNLCGTRWLDDEEEVDGGGVPGDLREAMEMDVR